MRIASSIIKFFSGTLLLSFCYVNSFAQGTSADTSKPKYPLKDRQGDFITDQPNNPVDLKDPANITKTVEYDPKTNSYVLHERIGDIDFRPPTYLTYQEYADYVAKQQQAEYIKGRNAGLNLVEKKGIIPPIDTKSKLADRLFGGTTVDIRPSGNIEMTLGGRSTKIANPTLPARVQKQGGFDFDMNINLNVLGKIGNKLQLNLNYNTQGGFNFNNNFNNLIKLQYAGEEDDIIQGLEAGTVSLPLNTQLITGAQALFGFKTKLRFGRLTMTTVLSQQKSKKESIVLENGVQTQRFEIAADKYDVNRHFFLAQFFHDQYNNALSNLPNLQSVVNINRIEVWVTNRTGATQNVRDIVAFSDLGEPHPYSSLVYGAAGFDKPANQANDLYSRISYLPSNRELDNITQFLQLNMNLTAVQDYEKVFARKLNTSDYTYDPILGYLSLNQSLNANEVLAVAFEYTYNGQKYQVGEFAQQVQNDSNSIPKVLFLKLLKATSARPNLPIWNLMMKNIYSIGGFNIGQQDFFLDIYYNDPGNGLKRYLPKGNLAGIPLIRVMNLDNLNNQRDPQPDGVFDFIPDITIKPQNGRIILPCTEPFGSYLRDKFTRAGDAALADKYVYDQLYDSTQVIAQQYPEFNRFVIKGQYKSASGTDINLGAFNLPPGSVTVTAGGVKLVEGTDYTVDYNLGRVKILNESVINSGNQIKIDFENNALFGFQQKSLYGTRLDFRVNEKMTIGATVMHLSERPFTQKVNIGEDPIRNTIMGMDIKYNTDAPWLTKALDKLPIYSTKDMSTISFNAEVARLQPGHSRAVGKEGQVYIDDFEGTSSGYDIKLPATNWRLASTPRNSPDRSGKIMFPEAERFDTSYNFNRAKLSWYNVDPLFVQGNNATPQYIKDDPQKYINHYNRQIQQTEVFPNKDLDGYNNVLSTFDLRYDPTLRGAYNYESERVQNAVSAGIDDSGRLNQPRTRWAGIMRYLDNTDFEASNVEYVEFWVMDPFIDDNNASRAGEMYMNLGTISEDILRDSRMLYENGLDCDTLRNDRTTWGQVPRIAPIVNAFDNDVNKRKCQDVGFDGMTDDLEKNRLNKFLDRIRANVLPGAKERTRLEDDPSSDDYTYYRDTKYDDDKLDILDRYSKFNGTEGNSPVQSDNAAFSNAATNLPDVEDLNRDNTVNENEEYYQYRIPIFPGMNESNNKYIVSKVEHDAATLSVDNKTVTLPKYTWYQFRIPVREFDDKVGNIQDFRSIQFIRLFMTGFEKPVTMRFARFELIRNQWRTYIGPLKGPMEGTPVDDDDNTSIFLTHVNIEENGERQPVNYVLPPGITRQQGVGTTTNRSVQMNEQALDVKVCNLQDGDVRAIYKNLNLDIRNYKNIKMFIHAESSAPTVNDKDVTSFLRIGSDFKDNFYQYEVPLIITPPGRYLNEENDQYKVWPVANNIDLNLSEFITLKQERNARAIPLNVPYSKITADGRILTILGNPDLGRAATVMLGVKNPKVRDPYNPKPDGDDGNTKCVSIWFNEMRLSGFEEGGGTATMASLQIKLADLGNVSLSTKYHSVGFGQLEQKVDQRYRDTYVDYDFQANIDAGKFIPKKAGFRIPFYGSYAQKFSTPQYDPYQLDIPTKDQFNQLKELGKDTLASYKKQVQTIETRSGFNFTNVRIVPMSTKKKIWPWSLGNFAFTYAYTAVQKSDPFIKSNLEKNYRGAFSYNYAPQPVYLYPFKKLIKNSNKWFDIIKEINFNPVPSTLSFNTEMRRKFGELQLRQIGQEEFPVPATYNKYFVWDRNYVFRWNPFKSLSIDYTAVNNSRIDEPEGRIDTKSKKQEVWDNVLKFGRNVSYNQTMAVSYNVPINKIPLLDWATVRANYNANYTWSAAPLVRDPNTLKMVANPLGNIVSNAQNIGINADLNIKKLYDKVPFLKPYNNPNPMQGDAKKRKQNDEQVKKQREKLTKDIAKTKGELAKLKIDIEKLKKNEKLTKEEKELGIKDLKTQMKSKRKAIRKLRKDLYQKQPAENPILAAIIQPLLALKKVTVNYTEDRTTTLPGFTQSPRFIGVSKQGGPGYDFAFGNQPGMTPFKEIDPDARNRWLDNAAAKGWISNDTLLNRPVLQTFRQSLDIRATFEPWRDIKVDLNWTKDYTVNHSQFFRNDPVADEFQHQFPKDMGTYTVTTIPAKTLFKKLDDNFTNEIYQNFEGYRSIISTRLQQQNPNSVGDYKYYDENRNLVTNPNFKDGYGPKSQDVLIPAFLAAYNGQDPNKVTINPFKTMPKPNWRISYNGLTNFSWAKKIFASFSISHSYTSTLSVNSFETNLDYKGTGALVGSSAKDSLNGNFFALYRMPNVVMNEQFSPLIGVKMSFKNNLTIDFDYKKSRTLTMSFADYQLNEIRSESYTLGVGYKIRGLKLPIKIKKKQVKLENDLNFRMDFSLRDNVTVAHRIDQSISTPTTGARVISIQPSIDYTVSKRVNVKLFVDWNRTKPYTSQSFPITNVLGGLKIRLALTP